MGRVFTLPKKQPASEIAVKAIRGTPDSALYVVIKSGGSFQVVNRSALNGDPVVVCYTASKKDWAIDWILLNDSQEAA